MLEKPDQLSLDQETSQTPAFEIEWIADTPLLIHEAYKAEKFHRCQFQKFALVVACIADIRQPKFVTL